VNPDYIPQLISRLLLQVIIDEITPEAEQSHSPVSPRCVFGLGERKKGIWASDIETEPEVQETPECVRVGDESAAEPEVTAVDHASASEPFLPGLSPVNSEDDGISTDDDIADAHDNDTTVDYSESDDDGDELSHSPFSRHVSKQNIMEASKQQSDPKKDEIMKKLTATLQYSDWNTVIKDLQAETIWAWYDDCTDMSAVELRITSLVDRVNAQVKGPQDGQQTMSSVSRGIGETTEATELIQLDMFAEARSLCIDLLYTKDVLVADGCFVGHFKKELFKLLAILSYSPMKSILKGENGLINTYVKILSDAHFVRREEKITAHVDGDQEHIRSGTLDKDQTENRKSGQNCPIDEKKRVNYTQEDDVWIRKTHAQLIQNLNIKTAKPKSSLDRSNLWVQMADMMKEDDTIQERSAQSLVSRWNNNINKFARETPTESNTRKRRQDTDSTTTTEGSRRNKRKIVKRTPPQVMKSDCIANGGRCSILWEEDFIPGRILGQSTEAKFADDADENGTLVVQGKWAVICDMDIADGRSEDRIHVLPCEIYEHEEEEEEEEEEEDEEEEKDPEKLINHRIKVKFHDNKFYEGIVQTFDPVSQKFHVHFTDKEVHWFDFSDQDWKDLGPKV